MAIENDKPALDNLIDNYNKKLEKFGISPSSVGWASGKLKERYSTLFQGIDDFESVLDIGCGLAYLYEYLKVTKNVSYSGTEINPNFYNYCCETYPESVFSLHDSLVPQLTGLYDVVVMSGLLNTPFPNNEFFYRDLLDKAFTLSKKFVTLNFLSNDVDFKDGKLHYTSLGDVVEYCEKYAQQILVKKPGFLNEITVTFTKKDK